MWFKKRYVQDAFDAGYWDGQQDNPYKLNNSVSQSSYRAGYLAGQAATSKQRTFANSELCYTPPICEAL